MRTAAALGLCVILTGCSLSGAIPSTTPVAGTTATPDQKASSARITPPPVTPPAPPGTNLPAFRCANAGGGTAGVAGLTGARAAQQIGYERFVLQFDNRVPTYSVKRQAKPVFTSGASGQPITLSGTTGVLVQIHSATAATSYTGPTDILHPDFKVLIEAKVVEDFEGFLSWGLGLGSPACFRTFTLPNPPRLVIDFKYA
jgi:hypothetical protein